MKPSLNIVVPDPNPDLGDASWYGAACLATHMEPYADVTISSWPQPADFISISCRFIRNLETYLSAINKAKEYTNKVIIGGMLPTRVPQYFEMLGVTIVPGWGELKLQSYVTGEAMDPEQTELTNAPKIDRKWLAKFYNTTDNEYGVKFASMLTTRGCQFRCPFCAQLTDERKIKLMSAEDVAADMNELYWRYGIERLSIWDDNFYVSKKRVEEIVDQVTMNACVPEMVDIAMRASSVNDQSIEQLKNLNVYSIVIGTETVDPDASAYLKPGVKVEDTRRTIELCIQNGIRLCIGLMVGWPTETVQSLELLRDFLLDDCASPLVRVDVATTIPYPGTRVETYERDHGGKPEELWFAPQYAEPTRPYMRTLDVPDSVYEEWLPKIWDAQRIANSNLDWLH